jgi:hypothetical protein
MAFSSPVTFRVGPLEDKLARRGQSAGSVAKRDLVRYYGLLSRLQATLPRFDEQELDQLIVAVDAVKPYWPGMSLPIRNLSLASKINDLSAEQQMALVDWLEQLRFNAPRASDISALDRIDA